MKLNIDDYYDLAAIGLCKAAISYDADKGLKFSTYAYPCMRNLLLHELRKERAEMRTGVVLYYDQEIYDSDGNSIPKFELLATNRDTADEAIAYSAFKAFSINYVASLSPRHKEVFHLLSAGCTQQKTAGQTGMSQKSVSLIRSKAVNYIKEVI